ncbi:low molecular weight phosphotyrosine protein phosphatase [Tritrichomonas foetus]|uniref:Low molecular weight phosphotyrosine protein phosphatase n=1 Tax=Tritrichomonas foetus TaxID=1144522 RepID=A0A1J4JJ64_9EUKA|nr:low molecular weight phosphotyrosine protein phosphatase [Tritrichomonas foetus]|eukprot:OHS99186.1 low molecular weight phosphotyrosine protein phosphatase [Tritrichomonas foetus]
MTSKPPSVLFVCLGNIIRSPICEGLLKHRTHGLVIDSAACTRDDLNQHPNKHAQRISKEHGFDISTHVSRLITDADFKKFDIVVSLENYVQRRLQQMKPKDATCQIVRFASYDIDNPWASPYRDFVPMYGQIERAMDEFIEKYIDKAYIK